MFINELAKRFWFVLAAGLLFTQIPLLNGLGYEAAASTGIYIHLRVLFGGRNSGSNRTWKNELLRNYWLYLQEVLLIALILTVNSIFVPKCDWGTGIWFWFVIPPITIWITLAVVDFSLFLSRQWGWWIARSLALGNLLLFFYGLAFQPPIIGFAWSFGWFAGSIYDEALSFSDAVFRYRLSVFLEGMILFLYLQFQIDRKKFLLRRQVVSALAVSVLLYGFYYSERQSFDIDHNQESVQKVLGGRLETEHFIVYFDPKTIDFQEQFWLKDDLEFRYWELEQFFQEDPVAWRGRQIEVFIYPNRNVQQRLMGSRRTLVARPWTHQMHIRWSYGEDVVAHELSHLFTAPFGAFPIQLSTQSYIWPNLGLIEGIAVAGDWGATEFNAHETAATLIKMEKAPSLLEIISPENFWRQPAGKAYQMMGSFTTWLVEEYGIENVKKAYRYSDFEGSYGKSIAVLHDEWLEFLKTIVISEEMEEMIVFRYERRTIFTKVCARAIAEEKRLMERSLGQGQLQKARGHIEKMLAWEPNNWRHHYSFANILTLSLEYSEAEYVLLDQLKRKLSASERAYLQEKLADIWWRNGRVEEAAILYQELGILSLSSSTKRRLVTKAYFAQKSVESSDGFAQAYFLDNPNVLRRVWLATQLSEKDVVGKYLLNFNWFSLNEFQAVDPISEELPAALQKMNWRIELRSAWRTKKLERVKELLKSSLASQGNENQILTTEYSARLDWKRSSSAVSH